MAEDERVALIPVLAKIFLELCRGFCLDVADLRSEAVSDAHESLIRPGVPRLVGDRARSEQRDLEAWSRGMGGLFRIVSASNDARDKNVLKTVENRLLRSTPIALVLGL